MTTDYLNNKRYLYAADSSKLRTSETAVRWLGG